MVAPLPRLSTWSVAVASLSICLCSVVRRLRILRFRFSKARSPAARAWSPLGLGSPARVLALPVRLLLVTVGPAFP